MHITPRVSIQIFGWFNQPHTVLMWADVMALNLTWRKLRDEHEFTPQQLHTLQTDKQQWIHRGGLRLADLPEMLMFPVNPLTDMLADIGELCTMQWDQETLAAMGVSYEQMERLGMTPKIMGFFRFPLSGWVALSLRSEHVRDWSEQDAIATFGLGVPELTRIIDGN